MAAVSSSPARFLLPLMVAALFASSHINATIFVPEEIPSLLSVVYSNLPPIKKGTDSRLGVGFRLGPNADVQFQLELGPQTNTLPIGDGANAAAAAVAKKRHATAAGDHVPGDWLNRWRFQMSPGYVGQDGEQIAAGHQTGELSDGGISDAVAHLRQLYKPQPTVAET
ncbi:Hypothetical protein CINCED_3A005459 [Cinara cedri]|uniref:Uncharacterized protein n=1 Tax=Cinara cedri TaxID=506608 RepID=A0A5E4NPM7_9HEMI|nr:Hypothetical protein CINCED_3A005459 [Cinara cedri]